MDFNKPSSCKQMEKFLMDNLKTESERESLIKVLTGKNVPKANVICLVLTLIQAMTISNEVSMEEFEAANMSQDEEKERNPPVPGTSGTQKMEQISGSQKKVSEKSKTICRFFNKGNCKNKDDCKFEHKKDSEQPKKNEKEKVKQICRFYKNGNCKYSSNCKYSHPTICRIYKQNGMKKFNSKGCEESCKYFHPNGCRDSLKNKTCSRNDCRFFHIAGTKIVESKWQENKNNSQCLNQGGCSTQNRFAVLQSNEQCEKNFNFYQNQSQPAQSCGNFSQTQQQKQVFQQDLSKTDQKIEALSKQMEEIHTWMRNQNQNQNSNNTDWRNPRN